MEYIYIITNSVSKRKYVGRSVNPDNRMKQHISKLSNHNHSSVTMQNDFDRYGKDSFSMSVVQSGESLSEMMFEYVWMIALKTYDDAYGYNSQDAYFRNPDGTPNAILRELNRSGIYEWREPVREDDKKSYKREGDIWRGNWLRNRLKMQGITMKECGEAIQKSEAVISKKINGNVPFYIDEIEYIGNFLGLTGEEKSEWAFGCKEKSVMDIFMDNVNKYIESENINNREFEIRCGLANGSINGWRKRNDVRITTIQRIAEKTDTTLEYWISENEQ